MADPPKDAPPDVPAEHLEKMEDIIKTRVQKGRVFITIQNALWKYRTDNNLTADVRFGWIRKMMQKFKDDDLAKKVEDMTLDHEAKIKEMEEQIEMLEERNAALWELAPHASTWAPETPIDGLISVRGEDFVKKYFAEEYAEYIEDDPNGLCRAQEKEVIPPDYNLYCKKGGTIYFFISPFPVDEDGDIVTPSVILDYMEKIIKDDGITEWGYFKKIRLIKGYSLKKPDHMTVDQEAKMKAMEKREYALWKLAAVALDPDEGVDDMNPVGGLISVHGKDYVKKYFAEEYAEYIADMSETDEDDEDDEDVTDGSGGDEGLAKKIKDMTVDGGKE